MRELKIMNILFIKVFYKDILQQGLLFYDQKKMWHKGVKTPISTNIYLLLPSMLGIVHVSTCRYIVV